MGSLSFSPSASYGVSFNGSILAEALVDLLNSRHLD